MAFLLPFCRHFAGIAVLICRFGHQSDQWGGGFASGNPAKNEADA
jgi:hypothetical protein